MKNRGYFALEALTVLVWIFLVFGFLSTFRFVRVTGESMEPTFADGSYVITSNKRWLVGDIQRGDVVLVRLKDTAWPPMIKRVSGVEGDSIYAFEDEPKVKALEKVMELKKDQYYLLGDNSSNSMDSRVFGRVTREEIAGKCLQPDAFLSMFPLGIPVAGLALMASNLWLVRRSRRA